MRQKFLSRESVDAQSEAKRKQGRLRDFGRERYVDLVVKMLAERAADKRDWGSLEK